MTSNAEKSKQSFIAMKSKESFVFNDNSLNLDGNKNEAIAIVNFTYNFR